MSAAAIAIGAGAAVSAAGSIASGQMQKGAAGKAAKAQGKASQKAAQTQEMWARYANQVAEENLARQKAEDVKYTQQSRSDMGPYAQAGINSLDQLMGRIQPQQARAAIPESGTNPQEAARITAEWDDVRNRYDAGNKAISDAKAALDQAAPTGNMNAILQAQQNYVNAQKSVEAINADYWNKKTQFTSIQPYQAAQAAITPEQEKAAERDSMVRKFDAEDFSFDPTSGGRPPPELLKDFDKAAWLKAQGRTEKDLTANFDQSQWLKEHGKSERDLTDNFDVASFLAKGGKTEGDLFRDFTMKDYQEDPGYQFRLEQGNKAINDSAAFSGGLLSGATQKAIAEYNSGQASQEYGKAFDRFGQQQQTAQNAEQVAYDQFGRNRENLTGQALNAFNKFGSDRGNLQGQAQQAFGDYNINRANASDVYQNAFNRWDTQNQNIFNRLQSIISGGQNAAANQAGYTQNEAGRTQNYNSDFNRTQQGNFDKISGANANNQIAQGDIQANRYAANANANSQMFQGIANAVSSGVGSYANANYQNKLLDMLKTNNSGGGGTGSIINGGGNINSQIANYLRR
ncbi:MAG: hypothetical protein WC465_04865 [Patescibacteria group bacterium]